MFTNLVFDIHAFMAITVNISLVKAWDFWLLKTFSFLHLINYHCPPSNNKGNTKSNNSLYCITVHAFECNIWFKPNILDLHVSKTSNIKRNKGGNRFMQYVGEIHNSHMYCSLHKIPFIFPLKQNVSLFNWNSVTFYYKYCDLVILQSGLYQQALFYNKPIYHSQSLNLYHKCL